MVYRSPYILRPAISVVPGVHDHGGGWLTSHDRTSTEGKNYSTLTSTNQKVHSGKLT